MSDAASPRPLDGRGAGGEGGFLEVPALDIERLQAAWQEAVFALYVADGKIEPEVVENMRSWPHSGFSVDQSVFLSAGDRAGIERMVQYMTRCPFSLSRLVKVTATGQVVYKAEKQACRAFPEAQGDGFRSGPKRNFQVLSPLEFLAEFTQHIPPTGSHLIRYYGHYSNKARGMRRKRQQAAAEAAATRAALGAGLAPPPILALQVSLELPPRRRASQTWAMLIKRVYEVDPLVCPKCGGRLKVIAFIEPPQADVIEKILRHCGLWNPPPARGPPAADASVHDPDEPRELTYVDLDTFESTLWADF